MLKIHGFLFTFVVSYDNITLVKIEVKHMAKLTEEIIRDVLMNNGIWLDDDMNGEYSCDGFRCYIWFNKAEDGFEIIRQIRDMPHVSVVDFVHYPAEREIKTVDDLNKALNDIFNFQQRFLDLFYEF